MPGAHVSRLLRDMGDFVESPPSREYNEALGYAWTRLTRTPRAPTLVRNAFSSANFSNGTRNRSRNLCVRLRCRDDARTGDAVLRFNALLVAPSPWPGLLQDN